MEASGMAALHDTHGGQPTAPEAMPTVAELSKIYSTQPKSAATGAQQDGNMPAEDIGLEEWLRLRNPRYNLN